MSANKSSDPEVKVLLEKVEEYGKLYNITDGKLDRSTVEHLYKTDEEFLAYDIAPPLGGYVGWSEYSEAWYKVLKKYSEINFNIRDDVRVFRRGDVGWSTFTADWFGKTACGAHFSKEFRTTLVWVKHNGEWRIAHEHGSSPLTTQVSSGEVV